jgi:hypothetical protein
MKATMSHSWIITLSLGMFAASIVAIPAHSPSAVAQGSVGSHPVGGQETPLPAKPRGAHPDGTKRSMQPSDIPDQTPPPHVQARALEERLRRGQMDRPIAQGQISDWLEQLHSGSAESTTGETVSGQAVQGISPD